MGIPIFSTYGDFTAGNVFIEDVNYIRLDPENAILTTDIIYNSLNDKVKLAKIGAEGKKLYHARFSWQEYTQRLLKEIKKREN